jgi:hypothetical protein
MQSVSNYTYSTEEAIRGIDTCEHPNANECGGPLPNPSLSDDHQTNIPMLDYMLTQLSAAIADVHPILFRA